MRRRRTMADGKRRLAVVVEIATEGERCRDWLDSGALGACPFFFSDWGICRLFHASLERIEVNEEGRFLRAPACLALDAPELSPAEAVARDLGAQHG